MSKKDLMNTLQAVNENFEVLKSTNGFDILEQKIGIKKDKFKKNTSFEFDQKEKPNYYEKWEKEFEEQKEKIEQT